MRRRLTLGLSVAAGVGIAIVAGLSTGATDLRAAADAPKQTGPCAPPDLGQGTGEGRNAPGLLPATVGELRIAMLFVEFADARGATDPGVIYDRSIPRVVDRYRTVSYERLQLVVTPVRRWLTLPGRAADYAATVDREAGMRAALEQAVAAADGEFDFGGYDALYLVVPTSAAETFGAIGVLISEAPVEADGARIHVWAWLVGEEPQSFGKDFDAYVVHETGHLLGLPDLYLASSSRTHHLWDAMAWGTGPRTGGMFAWHRWKLGWLDQSQIACLNGRRRVTTTVTPVARRGGVKAVVFRGGNVAYVAEVRQRLAEDSSICKAGVLIYGVRFGAPAGAADIYLLRASLDESLSPSCGPYSAAPFRVRPGRITRARLGSLRFELLRALPDGSYRMRVTRLP